MSGLCRLSIDIEGAFSLRLLAYVPLLTSSSSPSLPGVERQVQRKPEAFFFLGHIHFATIGLEFTFSPFGLGGTGMGIPNITGMAPAHVGQGALKADGKRRSPWTTSRFCLNAVGKRWRVWTREIIVLYLERLGWSGSPSRRVVSGSASDNAGGSDCHAIQTYLCRSHAVPLSHRVHLAVVA